MQHHHKHVHFASAHRLAEEIKFYIDTPASYIPSKTRRYRHVSQETGNVLHYLPNGELRQPSIKLMNSSPLTTVSASAALAPTLFLPSAWQHQPYTHWVPPPTSTTTNIPLASPTIATNLNHTTHQQQQAHPNTSVHLKRKMSVSDLSSSSSNRHSQTGPIKDYEESGLVASHLHRDLYKPLKEEDKSGHAHHPKKRRPKSIHKTKRDVYNVNEVLNSHLSTFTPDQLLQSKHGIRMLKQAAKLQNMELYNQRMAADLAARRHAASQQHFSTLSSSSSSSSNGGGRKHNKASSPSSTSSVYAYGPHGAPYVYTPKSGKKQYKKLKSSSMFASPRSGGGSRIRRQRLEQNTSSSRLKTR